MPTDWLDVHAGAVQAVSTMVLVAITIFYAFAAKRQADLAQRQVESAREQVGEARAQLAEMSRARQQTLRPIIYAYFARLHYTIEHEPYETQDSVVLTPGEIIEPHRVFPVFVFSNLGPGPALGLRGYFKAGNLTYAPAAIPRSLGPWEANAELTFRPPQEFRTPSSGQRPGSDCLLWLEYRDVFNQWWATRVSVRLGFSSESVGIGVKWSVGGIFVSDHRQEIRRITGPAIQEDTLAVDWESLEGMWAAGQRQ